MSGLTIGNGLYPYNPSLAEEVKRLLGSIPIKMDLRKDKKNDDVKAEFSRNGVDSDVFPDHNKLVNGYSDNLVDVRLKTLRGDGQRYDMTLGNGSNNRRHSISSTSSSGYGSSCSSTGSRYIKQKGDCVFCRNNNEVRKFYQSHLLKDRNGKVTCPILRRYICPICGATGDNSHTIKYCPQNKHRENSPGILLVKSMRKSTGKRDF